MHLIDAKCNNRIITSLFHFASTLATQNEIKKSKCNNYYIITKGDATVHDLVVVMRQSWEGGGGTLIIFFIRRLGPSIYRSPQKISGISSTPKIFEILANKKTLPILYLDLKRDPKMHRNDP